MVNGVWPGWGHSKGSSDSVVFGAIRQMRMIKAALPGALLLFLGLSVPGEALHGQGDDMCLMCHGDPAMLQGSANASRLLVTAETLAPSVHGEAGVGCTLCHQNVPFPHASADVPPVECSFCHSTEAQLHGQSLHGQAAARGDPLAPSCMGCHGGHDIKRSADPTSPTNKMNVPLLCGECHRDVRR